jgi:co-chaperonin GroES (HSP10)
MNLDKDLFPANKNMIKINGKKVLVRPSQAESTKGKEVIIEEERQPRMIRPKNLEIGCWKKNERRKPRSHLKVTFDIIVAKYRGDNVGIRGHKNQIIRFLKLNYPISLDQASTSTVGSSSSNQSRIPPRQNTEGRDHHQ